MKFCTTKYSYLGNKIELIHSVYELLLKMTTRIMLAKLVGFNGT